MNFIKKWFGRQIEESKGDSSPLPTRGINLAYPPSPENGSKLAKQFVDAVKTNESVVLDYSPETLGFVDNLLQGFKDEGLSSNDFAETIFVAGAYIGQIMVLHC
jgi:hypothetical protein